MEEKQALWKLIDVPLLQEIQDNCAKALGVAFVTVDYRGIPVTKYSGFTPHCMLGRKMEGFAEMCEQCDAHGGLHAAITGQPYIYRCHADLVDFSVPIVLNGNFMGALLGGQVRLCEEEERFLERIIPQTANWHANAELKAAYDQAEQVTYAKLEAAVRVVRDMIVHMIQDPKKAEEQPRKAAWEEPAPVAQPTAEVLLRRKEAETIQQQPGFRYFFFVMNMIAQLAHEEKAPLTQGVAFDFADVMRYSTSAQKKTSTLGEELSYVSAVLRIHQAWMRDDSVYTISVPKGYWGVPCPFMLLQPIVEGVLSAGGSGEEGGYHIDMFAEEEGGDLLFQMKTIGQKMTIDEIENRLSDTVEENHLSLYEADRNLKRMFGKRYYIQAEERTDGLEGMIISFRLPMN